MIRSAGGVAERAQAAPSNAVTIMRNLDRGASDIFGLRSSKWER
jgi:hypothetical protein